MRFTHQLGVGDTVSGIGLTGVAALKGPGDRLTNRFNQDCRVMSRRDR